MLNSQSPVRVEAEQIPMAVCCWRALLPLQKERNPFYMQAASTSKRPPSHKKHEEKSKGKGMPVTRHGSECRYRSQHFGLELLSSVLGCSWQVFPNRSIPNKLDLRTHKCEL